ncbi:MAG: hypothetical protein RLZZ301_390 [Bacteroidota bacterium]
MLTLQRIIYTAKIMRFQRFLFMLFLNISTGLVAQSSVDYSKTENWALLPTSMPESMAAYLHDSSLLEKADVFFVYPTLNTERRDRRWNVPIEDEKQRQKVLQTALPMQASAWAEAGRMYAPFYRAAHLRSYYVKGEKGKEALEFAYADVRAAFLYYLEHYNHGRPIILAGHSQGSTHIGLLLQEFFEGKPLQQQLIAAYMPGIGIAASDLPQLPLLTTTSATGGYVVWNTFKKHIDRRTYTRWYRGKQVVNPVSWNQDSLVQAYQHKGFLYFDGQRYAQCFDTHLIDGAIWIDQPCGHFGWLSFWMRNYHMGDINLFWQDIHDNAILRVKTYLNSVEN